MHAANARDFDLNLLVALDVLLQTGSVTDAAARLGLSQPAMSHRLRRLRAALGDPLLVPGRRGLVPTPRAQQLAERLRGALGQLAGLVEQPERFDPATARRTFHFASNDLGDLCVMPLVLARVSQLSPHISLVLRSPGPGMLDAFERGDLDLAVGGQLPAGHGLVQRKIAEDDWQCLARVDHPQIRGRLTPQAWAALPHLLVSQTGAGPGIVDEVLAARGLARRVAYRTPYFVGAPFVVARSDLVLTVPGAVARYMTHLLPLQAFPPPLQLPPGRIFMVFHERMQADAGHRWLRELAAACTREGIEGPAPTTRRR